EPDLAHQVAGQVVPEQPDGGRAGDSEGGGVRRSPVLGPRSGCRHETSSAPGRLNHARSSAPCSSKPGGGSSCRVGVRERRTGFRTVGTAWSPEPTTATGSSPRSVANRTPSATLLIG